MKSWTIGELARLRAMTAAGLSETQCAAALGSTRGAVSGARGRLGLCQRRVPVLRKSGDLMAQVKRLRRHMGVSEMADVLGVARSVIYEAIWRIEGRARRRKR